MSLFVVNLVASCNLEKQYPKKCSQNFDKILQKYPWKCQFLVKLKKKHFFLSFFFNVHRNLLKFWEHQFWFLVAAFTTFEALRFKKRNSAHSFSYLFQFFNFPRFSVLKVVRNCIICMKQSKFDWQNHVMSRECDSKLLISLF